jgi:hypothetical protein
LGSNYDKNRIKGIPRFDALLLPDFRALVSFTGWLKETDETTENTIMQQEVKHFNVDINYKYPVTEIICT